MKRFESIEFLKGYSIFTIIIFHYLQALHLPPPFSKLIFFGGTGIHLFILLSGLGLYLSYNNRPLKYVTYIKRRFSKVYIPYILVVIISALLSLLLPLFKNSIYALGGHIFLYKMFDNEIIGSYGYPLWFISMIIQFYLVFYLIVKFKKGIKSNWLFMIISLLISALWSIFVFSIGEESTRTFNSFFLQYFWEFALGMLIATYIIKDKLPTAINNFYFLLLGIVGCVIYAGMALYLGAFGKLFNDIPALIGYSSIALFLYFLKIKAVNNFFLFTGKLSYSLYLLHILMLKMTFFVFKGQSIYLLLILSLAFSYLFAYYYQNLISLIYKKLKI